jgi:predicted nucleotidyltransferase
MSYPDFEEFIAALNAHGVRYVIVGAHAVAHYARPRATKDLDVFLDRELANANRFLSALREFYRGADLGYTPEDVSDPDWIVQLGVAPVRIDVLTNLSGCPDFDEVWDRREPGVYSDVPTFYISLEDLLRSKRAAGRPQDKADLRTLSRVKPRQG